MTEKEKIESTIEAWESGELGATEEFVKAIEIEADDSIIDDALELQMISIRIQKSLLDELKMIASLSGLGYQPLMKQVLKRFVDCEKKRILRQAAAEREQRNLEEAEAAMEVNKAKKAC